MFIFGLLLPTCYISLITGISVPTQWPLMSIFLPALLWRKADSSPTFLHYLGYAFIAYAFLGLLWAPHFFDTAYGIWLVILWGLSFQLGYRTDDPSALYRGLAWGLAVQIPVVLAQYFGYQIIDTYGHMNVAGLLYNRTVIGALSALVILCLIEHRLYWHIPAILPGFILCGSRGGFVALAVGLASRIHPILVLAALVLACFLIQDAHDDPQRLLIWGLAIRGLTWVGYGADAFSGIYYVGPHTAVHAEYVHNDYLQLAFEFGVFALVPFIFLVSALLQRSTPTLWAFAALAIFYFPLYNPTTAFLGCFALGHAIRGISLHSLRERLSRLDLLLRPYSWQP